MGVSDRAGGFVRDGDRGGVGPASGEDEPAFGFGDVAAEFAGGLDPLVDGDFGLGDGFLAGGSVGGAAGEFGDLGDEGLVVVAPVEDDLVAG